MLSLLSLLFLSLSPQGQFQNCSEPLADGTNYTFYITFHDKSSVHHYYSNGSALANLPSLGDSDIQPRAMVMTSNNELLVANGDNDNSLIFGSGTCGQEDFTNFATTKLDHPYGLGLGLNPNLVGDHPTYSTILYASNQNTLDITYHVMNSDNSSVYGHDGTFVSNFKQLRGMTVDPDTWNVIAADEGDDFVSIWDQSGKQVGGIVVTAPIGVYVLDSVLYISSNDVNFPAVYAYDLLDIQADAYQLMQVFFTPTPSALFHPTGIDSCGDDLLVVSQGNRNVARFSKETGEYLGVVVAGFDDDPEQILVLNCNL